MKLDAMNHELSMEMVRNHHVKYHNEITNTK